MITNNNGVGLNDRIGFVAPTALHHYANGNWVVAEVPSDKNPHFTECDVNDTGKLVLMEIRSGETIKTLIGDFCSHHDLVLKDNTEWIIDFIENLVEQGILTLAPRADAPALKSYGDSDRIFPSHASIEVTERCNLQCGFCYLSAGPTKRNLLTYAQIIQLLDELQRHGTTSVDLTGGEFFLHPQAAQIIQEACKRFILVGVLTNGTILPESGLETLRVNRKQIIVNISLDSTNPALHNRIRAGRGAFQRTVRNVRRLTDAGIYVRIASVIFDENMWEIDKLAQLAIDLGAKAFAFNFVEGFGRGSTFRDDKKAPLNGDYVEYVRNVVTAYKKYIPVLLDEQLSNLRFNCGAGTSGISISADGYLRPCPLFPNSKQFGSIVQSSLEDNFEMPVYQKLLRIPSPSVAHGCDADCPLLAECGLCYLRGLRANVGREEKDYCSWVRENDLSSLIPLARETTASHFRKVKTIEQR